jgi:hypothetical protein
MKEDDLSKVPEVFRGKVGEIIRINSNYSLEYLAQLPQLEEYKQKYPTKFMVFKCMDGRILFSHFTGAPLGYLSNFRNLGGQFNLGWAHLQATFKEVIYDARMEHFERVSRQSKLEMESRLSEIQKYVDPEIIKRLTLKYQGTNACDLHDDAVCAIITIHYSKGSNETRGCAGSNCNIEKSLRDAKGFRMQIERACKDPDWRHKVFPIVIGIETDKETLELYGENGQKKDLAKFNVSTSDNELRNLINELYPSMPLGMRHDFLPFLRGNINHRAKILEKTRTPEELNHQEWILGVGRSSAYDWLHQPNTAILIGLFNPDLPKIINKGLNVIKEHNKKKYFLLMSAACYGKGNPKMFAKEMVKYYSRLAIEQVEQNHKELLPYMYPVKMLINQETQLGEILIK